MRLKGKGVPNVKTGIPGDMFVEFDLEVPTKLTPQQKELIRQFGESSNTEGYSKRKKFTDTLKDLFK